MREPRVIGVTLGRDASVDEGLRSRRQSLLHEARRAGDPRARQQVGLGDLPSRGALGAHGDPRSGEEGVAQLGERCRIREDELLRSTGDGEVRWPRR